MLNTKAQIEAELFKGRLETVTIELDGKRLRFSNLNKVYFPESGHTKRNLLAYYYRMADFILPFLRDRALVLRRYPDGIKGQAFFQKDVREGLPDWFKTVPVDSEHRGEVIHYATANDRASLLFLTGLGCIDHNPWSNRYDDIDHPDYFFFDLDPSDGTEFSVVVTIARALHEKLEELRLAHFLKTSGATGIHIYIPVEPVYTYEQLRTFGEIIARTVTAEHPESGHQRTHRCEAASGPRVDRRPAKCSRPPAGCRLLRTSIPASAGFHSSVAARIAREPAPRDVEHKNGLCASQGKGRSLGRFLETTPTPGECHRIAQPPHAAGAKTETIIANAAISVFPASGCDLMAAPRRCSIPSSGQLRVGTSGYSYKEWKGNFYPEKLPDREMLSFYAKQFTTVEINYTFYRMPTESTLLNFGQKRPGRLSLRLEGQPEDHPHSEAAQLREHSEAFPGSRQRSQ